MSSLQLTPDDRELLLDVAARSIAHGLEHRRALEAVAEDFPPAVRYTGCSFVTLRTGPKLRGCMGSMERTQAVVADVAANAFSAAFRDPRFPPLLPEESEGLSIGVSLLDEPECVTATTESDLRERMAAGREGWILHAGRRRGLLLPSVWEMISDPVEFLDTLKAKAGLPREFWSSELRFERFTATSFQRSPARRS